MSMLASGDRSIFKHAILAFSICFFTSGCSSVYYLYQAGKGQLKLLNRGKPVAEVIADPRTDPDLAALLQKIPQIKAYGEKWGLKPTPNYREYVKLDEDSVVYVVTVSDPLAFKPKIFSFPIVGSFNYLGWFSHQDAQRFAEEFAQQGLDIDVRGASAYSTLGWFRDPLLSSMIPTARGKILAEAYPELVNVFLHESVHATLYVANQSYFNEGLAVFVAQVLSDRYFADQGLKNSEGYASYQKLEVRSETIRKRFTQAYQDLKSIYDSNKPAEEKVQAKNLYLDQLQKELGFRRKITNATLIQFQTYHSSQADFEKLFERKGRDLSRFLSSLKDLKSSDFYHAQSDDFKTLLESR